MKKHYLTICMMLIAASGFTQAPSWLWAKSAGGASVEYGQGTSTDAVGNVYLVGAFQSSPLVFGTNTLTNNGDFDVFVTKYDATGNVLWARSAGGSAMDYGYGIATDPAGNVYITGWFNSTTITFGTTTLTNAGTGPDIFLVKYDGNGNVVWANRAGGTSGDTGYGVATDTDCNVYVTGEFQSTAITFGTTTLTNAGGLVPNDVFIAKYDSAGNALWAKRAGGTGSDFGNSVAVDDHGNAYLTGVFGSSFITFGTTTLTNNGSGNIFLTKYDSTGTVLWAKSAGGSSSDGGNSVALDNNGYPCIAGIFKSATLNFGATVLTNTGGDDVFVAKYDTLGNPLWANSIGGSLNDQTFCLTTDNLGHVYLSGAFQSSGITIGSTTLTNAGNYDVFIAKYSPSGNALWAMGAGDSGYDYAYSICSDLSGNIYVSGYFSSATLIMDAFTLTNAGGSDLFIGRLGTSISVNEMNVFEYCLYVFPNPANGILTIVTSKKSEVEILNIHGQVMKNIMADGKTTIDISGLASGMYFAKLVVSGVEPAKTEKTIVVKKFIKQ